MSEKSNLVAHARRELTLIGEEPETIGGYLKVVQAFANMRHSGGSAAVAIPVLNDLLQYKNLSPLTTSSDEWINVAENLWQNVRNSEAFSRNGGSTYYLLSEMNAYAQDGMLVYKLHDSVVPPQPEANISDESNSAD